MHEERSSISREDIGRVGVCAMTPLARGGATNSHTTAESRIVPLHLACTTNKGDGTTWMRIYLLRVDTTVVPA